MIEIYAEKFDDFKRKLAAKPDFPFEVKPEQTCIKGTPLWDIWSQRFLNSTDKIDADLQLSIEPDGSTYTFYRLLPKPQPEPAKLEETNV